MTDQHTTEPTNQGTDLINRWLGCIKHVESGSTSMIWLIVASIALGLALVALYDIEHARWREGR